MTDDLALSSRAQEAHDEDNMGTDSRPGSVVGVVEQARTALQGEDVSVRDVVVALGRASFPPLLMVPAFVIVTPASGVPLLSSICGITIALIAVQMVMGREQVWLPDWIMRRAVRRERLARAFDWMVPPARFLDRITRVRLRVLVEPPFLFFAQLLAFLSGAIMPFLEVLPFTSSFLGVTVSLLAVGMVTRDGIFVVAAWAMIGVTVYTGHAIITSEAMGATVEMAGKTVEATGKVAGETVKAAGEAAGKAVDAAGEAAGKAVEAAGEAAGKSIETASEAVDRAAKAATTSMTATARPLKDPLE